MLSASMAPCLPRLTHAMQATPSPRPAPKVTFHDNRDSTTIRVAASWRGGVAACGVMWYGVPWSGMVWRGAVWHGVAWRGVS